MAKPFTQTLISTVQNINLDPTEWRGADVTPDARPAWSIRKQRLRGGKQEGVDLVTIDNGKIAIRICPTRGMGIIDVASDDVRLGWDSPVKEIVNPAFVNLNARGGTGWLEGFNEYLVRCGLEFHGPPCDDTHHGAVGEPPAANITLHGRIANTPASEVEIEVETRAPYRITLRGVVHERMMYGPKFELTTELVTEPGSSTFTVTDRIRNVGGQSQEMGILYHINHGAPLLEAGSRFVAPVKRVCPRDPGYPKRDITGYDKYSGPRPGSTEQAFLMSLYGDRSGRTAVMLRNKSGDRAVSISYPLKQLPHFTLWKGLHDPADGYVTGLEPCTAFPLPRPVEREARRLINLPPSRSHRMELEFTLHSGKADVKRASERIDKIRARRRSVVDPTASSV